MTVGTKLTPNAAHSTALPRKKGADVVVCIAMTVEWQPNNMEGFIVVVAGFLRETAWTILQGTVKCCSRKSAILLNEDF